MENFDSQDLLECPYEKNHRILRARMQVHLGRCRRNHANVPKVTCPFNVTHVLNEPELKLHVLVCSERKLFEAFRHVDEPTTKPTKEPDMPSYQSEDNWDDDDVPSYNPHEYVENASVIRNIQGAPPAARKEFRQQERLRLLGLDK